MQILTSKVIPLDQLVRGEKPSLKKFLEDAKEHPWYLAGELFAISMMIVGAIATSTWAYELGRQVGRLM